MKRTHALLMAVAIAVAAVAGTVAALRTTQLGSASAPRADSAAIARQNRALDRAQRVLAAELRRKPPALPAARTAAPPSAAQTVVYVRPKPIVHVVHRRGEHEAESGRDGGGLDD
jgi:hypothetical protein